MRQHSLKQLLRFSVVDLAMLLHLVTIEAEISVLSKSQ